MPQSYVGKRAISKGIGRAIRKFVVFAFSTSWNIGGERPRSFQSLWGERGGRLPLAWIREEE